MKKFPKILTRNCIDLTRQSKLNNLLTCICCNFLQIRINWLESVSIESWLLIHFPFPALNLKEIIWAPEVFEELECKLHDDQQEWWVQQLFT